MERTRTLTTTINLEDSFGSLVSLLINWTALWSQGNFIIVTVPFS